MKSLWWNISDWRGEQEPVKWRKVHQYDDEDIYWPASFGEYGTSPKYKQVEEQWGLYSNLYECALVCSALD